VLVEERDPAADGLGVVARLRVAPGDVLAQARGEADRPVGGVALVGADGVGVAIQQFDPDVLAGKYQRGPMAVSKMTVVRRLSASTTPSRVTRRCRELGTASTRW